MEVSVIIPCRNAAAHIGSALSSLTRQDYRGNWEVLVVDNGSTDESLDVAREFGDRLPLRIYESGNRPSEAATRNFGSRMSQGSKLLSVDADDEVNESYVRKLAEALDTHECVAASFDIDTLNPEWSRHAYGPRWQVNGLWTAYGYLQSAGPAVGIRRGLYEEIGGHREEYTIGTDTVLCWCVQLAGRDIHFVPGAIYRYRFRNSVRGLYVQSRRWSEASAQMYREFQDAGMPRRSLRETVRNWRRVASLLPSIRDKSARAQWAVELGTAVGRITGSLRYRTWYV